jgi:colanic acid biosynthesis glycosyl transferase WcaI
VGAKIVFANRYFYPDFSATSQILTDLAQRLAQCGLDVHVVCSRQLYEDPVAGLPARERAAGVEVHRVWSTTFGRQRLLGRALDYLSFYLAAGVKLLRLAARGDVLVMKTDPPLLSVVGAMAAACRGAQLINWLQDVFPEVALRLYRRRVPPWAQRGLLRVRDRSLRSARVNVALGGRMRDYLLSRAIPTGRVTVIENWASGFPRHPPAPGDSELRGRLQLSQRFVVAYCGNLGRAHEFETIVAAAARLQVDARFVFLMIGGGAGMAALKRRVEQCGLANFRFLPYQPREALFDVLAAADVHLACLRPELEGLIVPSKIYGILAAARPSVFIGDPDGELGRLLEAAACGVNVRCGDADSLARELKALQADPQRLQSMGDRARALFEERYTPEAAVSRWIDVLATAGLHARPVSRARTEPAADAVSRQTA